VNLDSQRELTVLDAVHRDQHITQRHLSAKLGIALGLTNVYLRRLADKGYINRVSVQSNRCLYLLTTDGLAAKRRLTHEFMAHSLGMYRGVRRHLSDVVGAWRAEGARRIAVFGTGDIAELIYLSLKDQGVEPVAIFAADAGGTFLGIRVRGLDECSAVAFDRLLIALLEIPAGLEGELAFAGVAPDRILTLTPPASEAYAS
jgi:DNA-binding MarR family transcriptional regulator